jgi:hypothetical protein
MERSSLAQGLLVLVVAILMVVPAAQAARPAAPTAGASAASPPAVPSRPTPLVDPSAGSSFPVSFTESGLPVALHFWYVDLNGTVEWEQGGNIIYQRPIVFSLPNGTYRFQVGNDAPNASSSRGYIPSPSEGNVTVSGAPVNVSIIFTRGDSVTFEAVGLPNGSVWSITTSLGNGSNTTRNESGALAFAGTPGLVTFNVTAPSGFGLAKVTGGPRTTTYDSVELQRYRTTLVLHFGILETVYFNITGVRPDGLTWNVTLTPLSPRYAPGSEGTNVTSAAGASIMFTLIKGAAYRFSVDVTPTTNVTYGARPSHGVLAVPDHTVVKLISLRLTGGIGLPSPLVRPTEAA